MKKALYWVIMLPSILGFLYQAYKTFFPGWIENNYGQELQTCTVTEAVIDSIVLEYKQNSITQNIDSKYSVICDGKTYKMFKPYELQSRKKFSQGDKIKIHILHNGLCVASRDLLDNEEITALNKDIIRVKMLEHLALWLSAATYSFFLCLFIRWIIYKRQSKKPFPE